MFRGNLVALVTPFLEDVSVDYVALTRLIEWHIEQGSDGIVIFGTTGESSAIRRGRAAKNYRADLSSR